MVEALNSGLMNPTEVMAKFPRRMHDHMDAWKLGYVVNGCLPSG